jgi:hypothetical protein
MSAKFVSGFEGGPGNLWVGHADYQTQVQHENRLLPLADKLLLRKLAIIETVLDQLKNTPSIRE